VNLAIPKEEISWENHVRIVNQKSVKTVKSVRLARIVIVNLKKKIINKVLRN